MQTDNIKRLRQNSPLIHNITNIVVANYVANGLLSMGCSPIMSNAIEEMDELPAICQALVINIGTLTSEQVKSMIKAGKSANKNNIPVVLDPVGVGATSFRKQTVQTLLKEIKFDLIRGNAGEIAHLAQVNWKAKGVDAGSGEANFSQIAKDVALKYDCIVSISGEIDYISDGLKVAKIDNGTTLFPKITGSGCLLSAVCGAFLTLGENSFELTVSACTSYAIAGQIVKEQLNDNQTGQFYIALLDSLAKLDDTTVEKYAKISFE
ncbi:MULTISPECIES: hydroxyethylthiazole kinase [Arcobacteraceae]|uniref:Hydroxyethylthiazole kinase n=1 Tax=Poseidonibacter parvus TaxID=1850254 RepID=A0A1P8KLM5_9BACT|nr:MULTISPECIES: hydroxyethylthiazole kinase [Arcobacteraceae]APW65435.1 hydroxyethylthiazole kinase [Poseidonibacter parvus]